MTTQDPQGSSYRDTPWRGRHTMTAPYALNAYVAGTAGARQPRPADRHNERTVMSKSIIRWIKALRTKQPTDPFGESMIALFRQGTR